MKISVIMLTYNRQELVSRAIESILNQTFQEFEFIIVDNGSSDRSGEIADKYAQQDSRIRVIHKERGNIGSGRNAGLDAAKGEYIAFIDDDDWAEPDFLEFLLRIAEENQADVSICGTSDKFFDEKKIMTAEESVIELMRRKHYNTGFPTKMFQRRLMISRRFPENVQSDDIALMYKSLAESEKVVYYGLPKYNIFRHSGSNSAWTTNHKLLTPKILQEYLLVYHARTEWLSKRFPDNTSIFQYFEWSFMISMVEKIHRLDLRNCAKELEKMEKELSIHKNEFLASPEILDFEKEWMRDYV